MSSWFAPLRAQYGQWRPEQLKDADAGRDPDGAARRGGAVRLELLVVRSGPATPWSSRRDEGGVHPLPCLDGYRRHVHRCDRLRRRNRPLRIGQGVDDPSRLCRRRSRGIAASVHRPPTSASLSTARRWESTRSSNDEANGCSSSPTRASATFTTSPAEDAFGCTTSTTASRHHSSHSPTSRRSAAASTSAGTRSSRSPTRTSRQLPPARTRHPIDRRRPALQLREPRPRASRGTAPAPIIAGRLVSLSHRVANEWREYERTSSTVLNAYIAPRVEHYLERLWRRALRPRAASPLHVMQSSGGVISAQRARRRPI